MAKGHRANPFDRAAALRIALPLKLNIRLLRSLAGLLACCEECGPEIATVNAA
jgi:hypothetical protein